MSEADKMFEELGYEKQEDKYRINYSYKQRFNSFYVEKRIAFYKIEKDIVFQCYNYEIHQNITFNLTVKERNAINKKVQELGWLDE